MRKFKGTSFSRTCLCRNKGNNCKIGQQDILPVINKSGLLLIVHKEAVEAYKPGDKVEIDVSNGKIKIGDRIFSFEPFPTSLRRLLTERDWLII